MKNILFLLLLSLISLNTFCKVSVPASSAQCSFVNSSQCYCSVKCGYRNAKDADEFVWNNDKKMCFCKEWDKNHHNENCLGQKGNSPQESNCISRQGQCYDSSLGKHRKKHVTVSGKNPDRPRWDDNEGICYCQ